MLRAVGVTSLRDVRAFPSSRRNPHFNGAALAGALRDAGIDYHHMPSLGGRRAPLPGASLDNAGWAEPAFRTYADHALRPPFQDALTGLIHAAERQVQAVMCAEADWRHCHRRIIADYLLARGLEVTHLLAPGQSEPAALSPTAVTRPGGGLIYPPVQGQLFV